MIKKVIGNATLYCGDSNEVLQDLKDIDSCVTDPPYGLSFMGKKWDYDVPQKQLWKKVFLSLKNGSHLLSFFGSRTYHRGTIPIEDAGFEIRDQLMWIYGSGFPKSHNIGKAVDKLQGNDREVVGVVKRSGKNDDIYGAYEGNNTETKGYSEWEGWGTALKPAHEPIVMARKPFKGSVAKNVLEHGTGGINIDDCRIATKEKISNHSRGKDSAKSKGKYGDSVEQKTHQTEGQKLGRFPANVIHDGSDVVLNMFPHTKSGKMKQHIEGGEYNVYGRMYPRDVETIGDEGSASRFFYCAKASKKDRDEGLDALPSHYKGTYAQDEWSRNNMGNTPDNKRNPVKNIHPTVKPTELMRYLCRLVTPKGGVVLDPFMGSGSTGKAAISLGFKFVGIEIDPDYFDIACARIEKAVKDKSSCLDV